MKVFVRVCILSVMIITVGWLTASAMEDNQQTKGEETSTVSSPAEYELVLQQEQRDGSFTTKRTKVTIWAVEDFWSMYKDWELVDQNQEQIILRKPYDKA